ncbi:MAG: hypothetical protein HRU28_11465 [Rhizobiales bacterium]|nr:hypothetical protein [Hyphomicrobiales bacterium]
MAFRLVKNPVKISSIPLWTIKPMIGLIRLFASSKFYGPIEFFMSAMILKNAPQGKHYGSDSLEAFYRKNI